MSDWITRLARAEELRLRELNGGRPFERGDLEQAMRRAVVEAGRGAPLLGCDTWEPCGCKGSHYTSCSHVNFFKEPLT